MTKRKTTTCPERRNLTIVHRIGRYFVVTHTRTHARTRTHTHACTNMSIYMLNNKHIKSTLTYIMLETTLLLYTKMFHWY